MSWILSSLLFVVAAQPPQYTGKALTGVTVRPQGLSGDGRSFLASVEALSFDGRYILLHSEASNIPAGNSPAFDDSYVWDRATDSFEWISQSVTGGAANGDSFAISLTGDGAFCLLESLASNLVANDTNGQPDVFLYERSSGSMQRVSLNHLGQQLAFASTSMSMDDSGDLIVFRTFASNVLPGDDNNSVDLFIRNRRTGEIWLGGQTTQGNYPRAGSEEGLISGDGSIFVFDSSSEDIVPNDNNFAQDVFYRVLPDGPPIRISLTHTGGPTVGGSQVEDISTNGRWIVFSSLSNDIVPGDNNFYNDVFVLDRITGSVVRVSVGDQGQQANERSSFASISDDGRYVLFASRASNFLPNHPMYTSQVYVRDLVLGTTTRLSADVHGNPAMLPTITCRISKDGTHAAFHSDSDHLVPGDANALHDVFAVSMGELFDYGAGCSGSGSFVPKLIMHGLPSPGSLMTFFIKDALGGAPTWLYFGTEPASIPIGGGCVHLIEEVLPNPVFFYLLGAGPGNGHARLPAVIPPTSSTDTIYAQAFILDPEIPTGYTVTNGIQFTAP